MFTFWMDIFPSICLAYSSTHLFLSRPTLVLCSVNSLLFSLLNLFSHLPFLSVIFIWCHLYHVEGMKLTVKPEYSYFEFLWFFGMCLFSCFVVVVKAEVKQSTCVNTQFNLQGTPCLPLPHKRSRDAASTDWGDEHLIAAHYSFIDPERMKG